MQMITSVFQSNWAICGIYCRGLKSSCRELLRVRVELFELKGWALVGSRLGLVCYFLLY